MQTARSSSSSMSEDTEGCGGDGRVTCGVKRRWGGAHLLLLTTLYRDLRNHKSPQGSHKKYLITHPKGPELKHPPLFFSSLTAAIGSTAFT